MTVEKTFTQHLIEKYCCNTDLCTCDPYDVWKTSLGFQIKNLFNHHPYAGIVPAGILAIFDLLLNNRTRLFYTSQEYPIVRAFAALTLLNCHQHYHKEDAYLGFARLHLNWLIRHTCTGYSGHCWGLGFHYAVSKNIVYTPNTPFSTMTPYALEAFVEYARYTGENRYDDVIAGIYEFFHRDLKIMAATDEYLATSYVPMFDRIVTNAISYTMYALALALPFVKTESQGEIRAKVGKLYAYVRLNQREDGSWLYSPQGKSFIDCFHSCIILKNLIKTSRLEPLGNVRTVVEKGYNYVKSAFYDERTALFRRFTVQNKPSIIKYDLYDNAEMLNLAILTGDRELADQIARSIATHFVKGDDIFSQIDVWGGLRSKNTLRWAVMPYIYALSQMVNIR